MAIVMILAKPTERNTRLAIIAAAAEIAAVAALLKRRQMRHSTRPWSRRAILRWIPGVDRWLFEQVRAWKM